MSGNWNATGDWMPHEPAFTDDEIERAVDLRQHVWPDPRARRQDRCPHAVMCQNLQDCVQFIAWYLRHQCCIEATKL